MVEEVRHIACATHGEEKRCTVRTNNGKRQVNTEAIEIQGSALRDEGVVQSDTTREEYSLKIGSSCKQNYQGKKKVLECQ